MFNQKYLDDHDVIERYLADRLSEAEREGFEAYFMQHPEVVQQINRTAKLKSALMDLAAEGRLQSSLGSAISRRWIIVWVSAIVAATLAVIASILRR